jgi:NADH:ubiquinone oxidoreductase subunit 6 (subunit J)
MRVSNRALGRLPALLIIGVIGGVMGRAALTTAWHTAAPGSGQPTTYAIGDGLLSQFVLPFELASMVLLATLIGAVVLSRKELKDTQP